MLSGEKKEKNSTQRRKVAKVQRREKKKHHSNVNLADKIFYPFFFFFAPLRLCAFALNSSLNSRTSDCKRFLPSLQAKISKIIDLKVTLTKK